jgi:WD40 repeat protein
VHGRSLALSPDGKTIACASEATLRLWDAASRKPRPVLLNHHVDVNAVAFSPDGKYLASTAKTVRGWDVKTSKLLHSFALTDEIAFCLAVTSDSKAVATATFEGNVYIWDLSSGKRLAKFV